MLLKLNKLKKMNEIFNKFCPTTILLNVGAIGMSLSDVEIGLKIISYLVASIYTIVKIINEINGWRKKK
jgi:hypothetical protein|tara:strand:- start:11318 stop:11524 length:207 start_codon:yes stop_codon:yes gene_type:complete